MTAIAPDEEHECRTQMLITQHYSELTRLASGILERHHGHGCFPDPCELLNEACLYFLSSSRSGWKDFRHFRANICLKMRHLLFDQHRQRHHVVSIESIDIDSIAYPLPKPSFEWKVDFYDEFGVYCRGLSRIERLVLIIKCREDLGLDSVGLVLDCSGRHVSRILQRVLPIVRRRWSRSRVDARKYVAHSA